MHFTALFRTAFRFGLMQHASIVMVELKINLFDPAECFVLNKTWLKRTSLKIFEEKNAETCCIHDFEIENGTTGRLLSSPWPAYNQPTRRGCKFGQSFVAEQWLNFKVVRSGSLVEGDQPECYFYNHFCHIYWRHRDPIEGFHASSIWWWGWITENIRTHFFGTDYIKTWILLGIV